MKKSFIFFTAFLFSTLLSAKQPFFLQNWIIPEDVKWGTKDSIPPVEGMTFEQSGVNDTLVSLEIKPYEQSKVPLPPYFTENKLASWDMTYNQILKAFKDNDAFSVYENIETSANYNNQEEGIRFEDTITVVAKNEFSYEVVFYFGDIRSEKAKKSVKPELFKVFYNNFSGPLDPRLYWDENTELEKTIIALTAYSAAGFDYVSTKFDCSVRRPQLYSFMDTSPKGVLSIMYSINSKDDLYKVIDSGTDWDGKTYDDLYDLLQKYPDKKPYELAEQGYRTVKDVALMYFIKEMNGKMGEHNVKVDYLTQKLFFLRLAVGAGYITKDEALVKALPIVKTILSWYSSYEDFTVHKMLCGAFSGAYSLGYSSNPSNTALQYNQIKKQIPLDQIKFTGQNKGKEKALTIKDVTYKSHSEEELYWLNLSGKTYFYSELTHLPLIEEGIKKYGYLNVFRMILSQMRLDKYDNKMPAEDFFEKYYRSFWNTLPETEQYAIAFSSNLFELNRQFHLDFENRIRFAADSGAPNMILKQSWDVKNHDELIATVKNLEEYGHSGAFAYLAALIQANPGKSMRQLSADEGLSVLDTSRLYFVNEMKDRLGSHGIEAWDQAREITIIRWGLGAGYISADEAKALIEPVIARLRKNYLSYEDFICHYIAGRQFYGLYDGDYQSLADGAIKASKTARAYIPFNEISFSAENADKNHPADYSNCLFTPTEEIKKWENFAALFRKQASKETLPELEKLEKQFPEFKNNVFYWHIALLEYFSDAASVVNYAEENMNYLNSLQKDASVFANSMHMYLRALNNTSNPKKVLALYDTLPVFLQNNAYYYYQYAYANYLMLTISNSPQESEVYRNKAVQAFRLLKEKNFEMDEIIEKWLIAVEQ